MSKYDSIINLPHKQSNRRQHMSISNRAAQFAPFAALTGYDSAITETGRLTDEKRELSEETKQELNIKINFIADHLANRNKVTITYFQPDTKKAGGAYIDYTGIVKRIDNYEGVIVFEDGTQIFIDDITQIYSPAFKEFEG